MEELFRTDYHRLVWHLVLGGATPDAAQDAAQDAWMILMRRWDTVQNPRAYLRRVATHELYRARTREDAQHDRLKSSPDPRTIEPSDWADESGQRMDFVTLMNHLPAAQRTVMALHIDGFAVSEIAAIVGKGPSTVRSLIRHGRHRLMTVLAQNPEGADATVGSQ